MNQEEALERIEAAARTGETTLYLSDLDLTSLPPEIGKLTSLTKLRLHASRLTSLPPEIGELTNLTELSLSTTELTSLPPEIGKLKNLTKMHLYNNQLTVLPPEIGQLTKLTDLDLQLNQLTFLPPEIGGLTKLTTLILYKNHLASLPPEIGKLASLMNWTLSINELTSLPPEIGSLSSLRRLWLWGNQLTSLPTEIAKLTYLRVLLLHGNDALGLPPEVLGPSYNEILGTNKSPANPTDILAYYFRRQGESKRRLNEAKLLLVGQGKVGKTSLVRYLLDNERADPTEEMTEGIEISDWRIPSKIDGEEIVLNVWDFGGQEIMHATHQFFLTHRSLYLLVLDARKGENEGNLHYWLRIIQSFAGDSPVIVIVNQCDGHTDLNLNERRLAADYDNIQGFIKTSCTTGRGIEELREIIQRQVNELPHVFDELPISYFTIKDQLAKQAKSDDYLDVRDYRAICSKNSVTEEKEQEQLLRFLHDLGIVLNYNDPKSPYPLKDTHILNPKWVTDGVYQILTSPQLAAAHGVLNCDALGEILTDTKAYPKDRREFIVGMMRSFELCFDFPDSEGRRLLVPERLPENEPKGLDWSPRDALRFEYHYPILPSGVIPRFIVRTNHLLSDPPQYWRSGAVLNVDGVRAIVRGDTQKGRVFITVGGGPSVTPIRRREALSAIRDNFRAIHATIPKIGAAEKIPLPDRPDVVVDYRHLVKLETLGKDEYLPEGAEKMISVQALLDGVESFDDRRERQDLLEGASEKTRAQIVMINPVFKGDTQMTVDHSRKFSARDIVGSTINLGEIKDSVVQSIARIPSDAGEKGDELKTVLKQLAQLLHDAPEQGVDQQLAEDALVEVKTIAETARKPWDEQVLGAIQRTVRTMRRFGTELAAVPAIAAQYSGFLDHVAKLFGG